MNRQALRKLASAGFASLLVSFGLGILPVGAAQEQFPEGPGKDTFMKVCTQCHAVDSVATHHYTKEGWRDLVNEMKGNGANATDEEFNAIVDYLTKNFGKEELKVNINKAKAAEMEAGLALPSKEAQAIVEYRDQHGDFKEWSDLLKVPDVDLKKLEAAKSRIGFH